MALYNKFCMRCGSPFSTVNPETYKCDACRIIEATEEAARQATAREEYRLNPPNTNGSQPQQLQTYPVSIWEHLGNIFAFVFYGLIAYYIAWPMMQVFWKAVVFFGSLFF